MAPTLSPLFETVFGSAFSSPSSFAPWILAGIAVLWALFNLIIIYHWIRYSLHPSGTLFFLAVYVIVSLGLIGFALTGLSP